jgi:hypothetical protein
MTECRVLITARRVYEYLGISRATYYKLVDAGLPIKHVGGVVVAHADDLDAYFRALPCTPGRCSRGGKKSGE